MRPSTLLIFCCATAWAITAQAAEIQTFAPTYSAPKRAVAVESKPLAATLVRGSSTSRVAMAGPVGGVATSPTAPNPEFTFRDRSGNVVSAPVVATPLAKIDKRLSPTLMRAASIAQERAHAHSKSSCWRYVKTALMASGAISSYPKTAYAKQAGDELVRDYGFKKLPIRDPYAAPVGAVLVYGSRRAAGHVEIRTRTGFVSDFQNRKPSKRPLIGIYAKA